MKKLLLSLCLLVSSLALAQTTGTVTFVTSKAQGEEFIFRVTQTDAT